jgi:type II secretory pathway pseudopilin PulG
MDATVITDLLIPAIGSLLVAALGWATAWIRSKAQNEHARTAINLAQQVIEDVVLEMQHTVVERLRVGGQWDAAAKADVKASAVRTVLAHIGRANVKKIDDALGGGAADWIGTRLEATVARINTPRVPR